MADSEEALKRLTSHPGVLGAAVLDENGQVARYTLPTDLAEKYGNVIYKLQSLARTCVRDVDPTNDLMYVRIDTKKFEILVAPFWGEGGLQVQGKEKGYTLFVLQRKPNQMQ